MEIKTAKQIWYGRNPVDDGSGLFVETGVMCMQDYARQVAIAVRAKCAETGKDQYYMYDNPEYIEKCLLMVDIDEFIK